MNGARRDEYQRSRQKIGVYAEQVWLQHTPDGDMVVVRLEADDIPRMFDHFMKSTDPFDTWFREKILVESHGMDPSKPFPQLNEQILNYTGQPVGEKKYTEARRK
jgi:hypothetical protein